MSFFRHVGTANGNKKVIIIQRELPGEDHMASVIFSDIIPSRFHDDLMKELESDAGQSANEFKEVLERRFFSNGENMLQALHAEGYIKKVAANNIVVRPNSKSSVPLDELNKLLREMRAGGVAIKTLAEMDSQADIEAAEAAVVAPAAAPAAPAIDQTALMMQMMQTMQQMQQELAALKAPAKKTAKSKTEPSV
jgi:hypothetical protein